MVAAGAILWGTIGLFFKAGLAYGLTPLGLAFMRSALTFGLLALGLALWRPTLLRIRPRDLPYFALFGGVSVALFYWVYIVAVDLTTVATAAVLLYTAPAWVTLLAWRLYGEPLHRRQLLALGLAFLGCVLVARAYDPAQLRVNWVGLLAGLGAGFTYAMYSVLGVPVLRRYPPTTVVVWAVLFGALLLAPFVMLGGLAQLAPVAAPSALWLWLLGLAAIPTVGALLLYTSGLKRVPAGVASVTATLEPVVATLLAVLVLKESFAPWQMVGGALILGGILLLAWQPRRQRRTQRRKGATPPTD
ncbi:MAG: EamA family transporter [Anaerolineae bacterium]